jgi:hypothetical protein
MDTEQRSRNRSKSAAKRRKIHKKANDRVFYSMFCASCAFLRLLKSSRYEKKTTDSSTDITDGKSPNQRSFRADPGNPWFKWCCLPALRRLPAATAARKKPVGGQGLTENIQRSTSNAQHPTLNAKRSTPNAQRQTLKLRRPQRWR